ncbi:MAG: polysaccharide deacetylase family protein [Solirubrobacterales bacterium]|nr:polysaccharide deacetylase family protein [Solirubrobacterales bacterium]
MAARLGRVLAALIRFSGLAWLVRNTLARDRVSILLYHDPAPEDLESQLRWLLRRYSVISLERFVDALRSGNWSALPPRSLVITIDDGRAGNFALLEAFRRHRVVPTIFICTGMIDAPRACWAKGMDEVADRALGSDELGLMLGACDFQSHTRLHPRLPGCGDAEAWEEIASSQSDVEALTGAACDHFAYPAGAFTDRDVELLERAGYLSARTVDIGWNHAGTDPYRLRVLSMDPPSVSMLAAELSGQKWLSRLVNGKGGLGGKRVHARS